MSPEPAPSRNPKPPRPVREFPIYLGTVGLYFFAFGLQFVLFPSLVTFVLEASPAEVGLAQMTLTGPMVVFLLWGGVLAERVRVGPALGALQALFAVPALALAGIAAIGGLNLGWAIAYAFAMGTLAAFMLPIRDAALNGVIERDRARGHGMALPKAAAATTAVQIGAQILGILVAQLAGAAPGPFFAVLALAMAVSALFALRLQAPPPPGAGRSVASAFGDVKAGLAHAFKNQVMGPMLWSAAFVGVFVIGTFQVLFPLIVRETYGGGPGEQSQRLSALFACFWGASFVSAVALSRLPPLERPGRALLVSHMIGAGALATFAVDKPFWVFCVIVGGWGLACGVAMSMSRTITQTASEPAYLGRVLATYSLGFMGGAPIGSAISGFAAGELGARPAALIPAVGLLVATVLLAVLSPIWRLDGRGKT